MMVRADMQNLYREKGGFLTNATKKQSFLRRLVKRLIKEFIEKIFHVKSNFLLT